MKTINRKQLHEIVNSFIGSLHKESIVQMPLPLVILGNSGIGKTSIVLEEAEKFSEFPTKPINLERKLGPDQISYDEFDKFYLVSMFYYDKESHLKIQKPLLVKFLMEKAIPIYSSIEDQKAVIIEVTCSKNDVDELEELFKNFDVYYYRLLQEDFIEWSYEANPKTGLPNNIVPSFLGDSAFTIEEY